jgi:Phosphatidylglycerol lysyltransferase, C-terminal
MLLSSGFPVPRQTLGRWLQNQDSAFTATRKQRLWSGRKPWPALAGGKRANLRAMVNKVLKCGMSVCAYDRKSAPNPALDEQLEAISQEWLAEKALGEMGFTIGRFSLEALEGIPSFSQ